jgi:hypothetical protein
MADINAALGRSAALIMLANGSITRTRSLSVPHSKVQLRAFITNLLRLFVYPLVSRETDARIDIAGKKIGFYW